ATRLDDRRHNLRMRMSEDQGPPGRDEVQVGAAVHINQMLSRAALDEERCAADGFESSHGGIDAAGDDAAGAFVEFLGTWMFVGCISHGLRPPSAAWFTLIAFFAGGIRCRAPQP